MGENVSSKKQIITMEKGKKITLTHNRPLSYELVTANGSVIEVTLPAGVEMFVTNQGDITEINMSYHGSPTGPQEAV